MLVLSQGWIMNREMLSVIRGAFFLRFYSTKELQVLFWTMLLTGLLAIRTKEHYGK